MSIEIPAGAAPVLRYAKLIASLVGAAITSVIVALVAAGAPVPLWLAVVSAVLTAVATWAVPNAPTRQQSDAAVAGLAALTPAERDADIQAAWARQNIGR